MNKATRLLAATLALAGCETSLDDDFGDDALDFAPPAMPASETVDELAAPDLGSSPQPFSMTECENARMIALLSDPAGSCDLGGGGALPQDWVSHELFSDGSPGVLGLSGAVPAGLAKFCSYEWTGAGTSTVGALQQAIGNYAPVDGNTLAADCRGQTPQSGLDTPALSVELRDAFRSNIDALYGPELFGTTASRVPVDVALPDTVSQAAADNPLVDPTNAHGLHMADIIRDVACPGGAAVCSDSVRHTLALPINTWEQGPQPLLGGVHGTLGDLAMAVYEAVGVWRDRKANNEPDAAPRLVINLSLGFTRMLDDTLNPGKGPAKALDQALVYASCQGALIIAAAGNTPDEACPSDHTGPLAPASFETKAAPTALECAALGFSPPDDQTYPVFGGPGTSRPLVYAVGGVDERDEPLINARSGGRPRLAALGSNAVANAAPNLTPALTGSSVSSAVVSGTAALIWSFREDLRPDEVMSILYDNGWEIDAQTELADFGLGGGGDPIHRVSVCASLAAACTGLAPNSCPQLQCTAQSATGNASLDDFFNLAQVVVANSTAITLTGPASASPACDLVDLSNLSTPQPDLPPCKHCHIKPNDGATSNAMLNMTISAEYTEGAGLIDGLTLVLYDSSRGRHEVVYDDDATIMAAVNDETAELVRVELDIPTDTLSAALLFRLTDGSVYNEPVPVRL